jgi:glutamate-1-semialdehyde 2,1-aminomutase
MTDDFARATPGSRDAWARASARVPGGVTSNVRYFPPHPVFMARGHGARLWDVDGREYLDYCLAFGPQIAGHGHPRVLEAITRELARAGTTIFGTPTTLELELAERLARLLPSAEMVRFTNSGTEATMHALRVARGVTGRPRIVKFEGHYHGVHDSVLMNVDAPLPARAGSDGIPQHVQDATLVIPFNDPSAVDRVFAEHDDVAAVIVEPIARGVIQPRPGFLEHLRAATTRAGALLIFDEIVVWPRVGLAGAQGLLGVTPDLTTLGKAIGGGLPLAALVGRRDVLREVEPKAARGDRRGPYVFHGGTYNGTPIALAAGLAVLDLLAEPGAMAGLMASGEALRAGLREVFADLGVTAQVIGRGAVADFYFTAHAIESSPDVWASDLDRRRALDYALLVGGIFNAPVHRWHLSLAHTRQDLDTSLEALRAAFRRIDATVPGGR